MSQHTQNLMAVLVEKFSYSFSGYDLATGERLFSARLPDYPHEFAVSHDQRFAYVGHYGVQTWMHHGSGGHQVCVIDLKHGEYIGNLECAPFNRIHGIQVDRANRVYALSEEGNTLLVFENPEKSDLPTRAVPVGGLKSHLMVINKAGSRAYTMNMLSHTVTLVHPFDATKAPIVVNAGTKPEGCCLNQDESILYVASRGENTLAQIDALSMNILKKVPTGDDPTRIYFSRDHLLYVTNYGECSIGIYDPETLEELHRIPTEHKPIALAFHPTLNLAYIPLNNNTVAQLDLDTLCLSFAFKTGLEPDGLVILPRQD
jgi:DNA-binding beta-propeller fold protein YncE